MCWGVTQTFAGLDAPAKARRRCLAHLRAGISDAGPAQSVLDDAAVIISELVTNAIVAGTQVCTVTVELHRDHVYLAVGDDAPGQPTLGHPTEHDVHGRGLLIVDSLARSWGTDLVPPGKRVWAELTVPPAATVGLDCGVNPS
jgi:anti-sigma regulatory factor (Ser/Thr protein kinase)